MSFGSIFGTRETHDLPSESTSLLQALTQEKDEDEHTEAITSKERALKVVTHENLTLRERVATLEKELQACKDDLFRLQPLSQVPDSTIAQHLEDLNTQICDWIAVEISRSMDEHRQPGDEPKLFYHGKNRYARAFLADYPESGGEYYVRSVLHHQLQHVLFSDTILLFALDRDFSLFLQSIEHGMSQLEPSRGRPH